MFYSLLGMNPKMLSKKKANFCVILVPLATICQSLKTIFPVVSSSHFRLLRFKKQGFPRNGKSRTAISSKSLGRRSAWRLVYDLQILWDGCFSPLNRSEKNQLFYRPFLAQNSLQGLLEIVIVKL